MVETPLSKQTKRRLSAPRDSAIEALQHQGGVIAQPFGAEQEVQGHGLPRVGRVGGV